MSAGKLEARQPSPDRDRHRPRGSSGTCGLPSGKKFPLVVCNSELDRRPAMAATHALFESASGYAIFEVKLHDSIGALTKAVQASIDDYAKFSKMVTLLSFAPYKSAAHALENANDISEGMCAVLLVYAGWFDVCQVS